MKSPEVVLGELDRSALTPIVVTLVGRLDDVLVDAFAEVVHGFATGERRPLILDVSDLIALRGEAADRIAAMLTAVRAAGIEVTVDVGASGWRKLLTTAGVESHAPDPVQRAAARRRCIIARSGEHAA